MKASNHKKLNDAFNNFLECEREYARAYQNNPSGYEAFMWEDFRLQAEVDFHKALREVLDDEKPKGKVPRRCSATG